MKSPYSTQMASRRSTPSGMIELSTNRMTNNLPQVHDVEKELRKVINEFPGRMLIGETYFSNIADLRRSYGLKNDELQLPMDFQVGMINKLDIGTFRKNINDAETTDRR